MKASHRIRDGWVDTVDTAADLMKYVQMATGMKRVVLAGVFLAVVFPGVEGGVSELDSYMDRRPIKIAAFNIQIFGETTYLKEGVRRELIKVWWLT